jgi:hypothetical protein
MGQRLWNYGFLTGLYEKEQYHMKVKYPNSFVVRVQLVFFVYTLNS